jgi:hypothetical protein
MRRRQIRQAVRSGYDDAIVVSAAALDQETPAFADPQNSRQQ